jgi:WhiB family redox-sensing transcriptional regulator
MGLERPAWQKRAACRGVGTEVFFPDRYHSAEEAKELCASCPVAAECLAFAMTPTPGASLPGTFGVWGGLSHQQRRLLRRRQRLAEAG